MDKRITELLKQITRLNAKCELVNDLRAYDKLKLTNEQCKLLSDLFDDMDTRIKGLFKEIDELLKD